MYASVWFWSPQDNMDGSGSFTILHLQPVTPESLFGIKTSLISSHVGSKLKKICMIILGLSDTTEIKIEVNTKTDSIF